MSFKTRFIVAIVAVAIAVSVSFNVYFIRTDAGGFVLWNDKEAYFFIGRDTRGHHVKWIAYPFIVAKEMLGDSEDADDDRGSIAVIHVTPSGVERHDIEQVDRRQGTGPSMFTPLEGRIWANWPTLGGLCWWAGNHFEQATQEERRRLDGINHLTNNGFKSENGWSKDGVSGQIYTIKVGDEIELIVDATEGHGAISIDLRKRGGGQTRVFSLDVGAGRVSGSEYRNAFLEHK